MEFTSLQRYVAFRFSLRVVMAFILLSACQRPGGAGNNDNGNVKSLKEGDTVAVYRQKWRVGDAGELGDPGPSAGKIIVKRLRKETGEEDTVNRSRNPPIQLWYLTPGQEEVRWIQIVTKTNPKLADLTRPNFDALITKGEFKEIDPNNDSAVKQGEKRNKRIKEHNPFYPLTDDKRFRDAPWVGYHYFETFIILCMINEKTNPDQWQAEIIGVWKWIKKQGEAPELIPTKSSNVEFKKALDGAKKDFDNGFEFGKWYLGKPPASKV